MHLYNLTLQKPGAITHAINGNFSAPKAQEIVVARGKILELLRVDDDFRIVVSVLQWEIFGVIRSLKPFRLTGGNRDYIIVGSDSGKITVLQYDPEHNRFKVIHNECYGKSGCRRIVPGEFLASDPKGRAVMIGAIEKQKFVYVLNRDSEAKLIISSPLEAHKSHSLTFDICGVDVDFDNPTFACLEIDYEDVENEAREEPAADIMGHKLLSFYELDLGLNHVTRKAVLEVDPGANLLITVPGGSDGPGGVLVCAENWIIYQNPEGEDDVRAPIPRRAGTPDEKGLLITSYAVHKQRDLFFFLVQSELGDIYKVTLSYKGDEVHDVHVKYFDTVPVASSMCLLRNGYLFVAAEFGNHCLFTFQGIGEGDDSPETSSFTPYSQHVYFTPRKLTNLDLEDEPSSLAPIIDMKVEDLAHEGNLQIYSLCGRGPRSTLRVLRHGLSVTEMAVSEIPGNANAVWSIKKSASEMYHNYIIVSFVNGTMVLSIGDTVEEVSDSGFELRTATLGVALLGSDILIQIHPKGIRLIRSDGRIEEWKPPSKKDVIHCDMNERQVVIAMTGGEIAYFELDTYNTLMEIARQEVGDVSSVAIAPILPDRRRANFMAAATVDGYVKLYSLSPDHPLNEVSMTVLQGKDRRPNSVLLEHIHSTSADVDQSKLYLFVGMYDGTMIRHVVDSSGQLSDKRPRYLGGRPVKLFSVKVRGLPAVIALSSRSWLTYTFQSQLMTAPLSYDELEYSSHFSSNQCPEGLVSISSNTLRIVTLEKLGELFNQTVYPLRYTPRAFLIHPISLNLIIIETDHGAYPYAEKTQIQETFKMVAEGAENEEKLQESFIGVPKNAPGRWASCISIINPINGQVINRIELEDNNAATSLCMCEFTKRGKEKFLVVGTVKDYELMPRKWSQAAVRVYQFHDGYRRLIEIHATKVQDIPLALCPYKGMLLVGVGKILRLYDIGKTKLLRKCENRNFPNMIKRIHVHGERIYVGDACESFHMVIYRERERQMYVFADNAIPRFVTASEVIDYNTIAFADKFGNFVISRLIMNKDEGTEQTWHHAKFGSFLNAAPVKLVDIVQYHVGETITSIIKARLTPGGEEVIIYSTIMGSIGVFYPFKTKPNVEFFTQLEMHLRLHNKPICGRDHLAYRSYYTPVCHVVDGDLCEQYASLDHNKQLNISNELVKDNPSEVVKKMDAIRTMLL